MAKTKWIVPAIGAGALVAASAAGRRLVSKWRANPDPLNGKKVAFPAGEQRMVTTPDGAQISTVTLGAGPTIVLVHGLTSSRHDWGPMAPALVDAGYRLIAVEQRGHGDSTVGTAGFGSSQLGADLAFVFAELDIRAAALIGHSMGGMASMAFAVDHPTVFSERVSSLVLIATAASLQQRGSALIFRLSEIAVPDRLQPSDRRLRVGAGLSVFGKRPSLHMIDEAIRSSRRLPEAVRTKATSALGVHNVLDRIGSVARPTLVIGGTHDRLIRPAQVAQLAAAIPGSELQMLEGAGHMLIWERHERVDELVLAFLSSVEAPVH